MSCRPSILDTPLTSRLLKPVLVELGATCPTRGLFLLESEYAGGETLDTWLETARPQVQATVSARSRLSG